MEPAPAPHEALNFIEAIVKADLDAGGGTPVLRFPPEPNGYLHVGHAKAICVNFGIAARYGGRCHLRFDDTNPVKESTEYVESMQADVRWLGFDWGEHLYFTSDYFDRLYELATQLIERGVAYVCDLTPDQTREYRGTVNRPGRNSPFRERPPTESLDLLGRMQAGEFPDGSRTLRAKIDMASPNLNMRDPVMYRILKAHHHRTGDAWSIYPMYDWAHGQSDAIEGITHSLCSLEFENHRPLYDWFLEQLDFDPRPKQREFARLQITHTLVAKRKLVRLVEERHVSGWDDPRMPTLRGLRRRGYTPESIRSFCDTIGLTKFNSTIDMAVLENAVREDLNRRATRRMAVLRPLKLVVENYPEAQEETFEAPNNPEDPDSGTRTVYFGRELWIERDDFLEDPPRKYFRLAPGKEVRLRYGYCVTCTDVIKDASGEVVELRCTYDPETGGGQTPDGRKVKGIIHWVCAARAIPAEVRLYDHLFTNPDPDDVSGLPDGSDYIDNLNADSLEVLSECRLEPAIAGAAGGDRFQFERVGYFCADADTTPTKLVFNRTASLRDTWAKIAKKG